jgi:DNA-binding response OmpR family regulator
VFENRRKARVAGGEIELERQIGERLKAVVNASWFDTRDSRNAQNLFVERDTIPSLLGNIALIAAPRPKTRLAARWLYVGDRRAAATPAYSEFSLTATQKKASSRADSTSARGCGSPVGAGHLPAGRAPRNHGGALRVPQSLLRTLLEPLDQNAMRPARPRVLIVDDQAPNIDVLAEALGEGYELFAATSADRAIELAASGMDLILLDVVMPEQNGFDLCRALKARERPGPFGHLRHRSGRSGGRARGFEAGGVDYITKPISPPTVRARVRTHLELRGAHKRPEEAEVLAENLRLKEHVERLSRHDEDASTSVISIPQILLETPASLTSRPRCSVPWRRRDIGSSTW